MSRQVEHNTVRLTGVELGKGTQISGTTVTFNAVVNLSKINTDQRTLYDICLIDDIQGFVINTQVRGIITLVSSDRTLSFGKISISLLNSYKEKTFNVT